jgi:glycerol-3-phosphate dehydrogenase
MDRELRRMSSEQHDLIVIGGGVLGAMIAWDASLRGLKVALVEKDDFAAGASSHNSKFIHGGLNHLEAGHLGLVREFITERRIWSLIAPHLTRPMPFLLPSYNPFALARTGFGLHLHSLLAFDRDLVLDPDLQLPGPHRVGAKTVKRRAPFTPTAGMTGAYLYYECQMRFPERLVIELLRGAVGHGARVANYAEAGSLIIRDDAVIGVEILDRLGGWRGALNAPAVISAAGPWTHSVLGGGGRKDSRDMGWVRGVHILTDAITCDCAVRLPVDGGNLVFSRWRNMTLIGTLNTHVGALDRAADNGIATKGEVEALIAKANRALRSEKLTLADVRHAFSAVRPAPKGERRLSNAHWEITDHSALEGAAKLDGMLSVVSGNWTRARSIAERAVDLAAKRLEARGRAKAKRCRTRSTALWGGEVWRMRLFRKAAALRHPEIAPGTLRNLVNAYGSRYREVLALATADDRYWARLDPMRPEIAAQVIYAVRREWARTLDDVLYRRLGAGQTGEPSNQAIETTADLMAQELDWTPAERAAQIELARKRYRFL